MTDQEFTEWLDGIHELHRYCQWFRDVDGMCFSLLWYEEVTAHV